MARVVIEVLICVGRFSVHTDLYATTYSGCCCVQEGEPVVFLNLLGELYVRDNGIQMIVKLLHVIFLTRSAALIAISCTMERLTEPWKQG